MQTVLITKPVKMQIIDEKSLIKKYQNEIRCLKEELEQLKRGIVTVPQIKESGDDIVLLKQKVILDLCSFSPHFAKIFLWHLYFIQVEVCQRCQI